MRRIYGYLNSMLLILALLAPLFTLGCTVRAYDHRHEEEEEEEREHYNHDRYINHIHLAGTLDQTLAGNGHFVPTVRR